VEILLMVGAFPVEQSTAEVFFGDLKLKTGRPRLCVSFRRALRLIAARRSIQFISFPSSQRFTSTPVTSSVHRFEESIAGRPYLIEVVAVSEDRWRAYIVRIPGVPTALMPFYGATPSDAAHQLCDWLTRAYARAANPAGTV
jgi:hypothetical protein